MTKDYKGGSEESRYISKVSSASGLLTTSQKLMMNVVNKSTGSLLMETGKILYDNFGPYFPHRTEIHEQGAFFEIKAKLFDDNLDIEKSSERGFRDLVRGDELKTEFKKRIKSEFIDPLRNYINEEETITKAPKEEINAQFDAIEEKYYSAVKSL